jgi:hypothetical protein
VSKPAGSLQSVSRLFPLFSPPPHHLASLQHLIIITGIRIAWRVTDICTICILHTRSDQGEKNLSCLPYIQSTGLWSAHLTELWYRCVWVEQGFRGFLDLREKILFLNRNSRGLSSHRGLSFFIYCTQFMWEKGYWYSVWLASCCIWWLNSKQHAPFRCRHLHWPSTPFFKFLGTRSVLRSTWSNIELRLK